MALRALAIARRDPKVALRALAMARRALQMALRALAMARRDLKVAHRDLAMARRDLKVALWDLAMARRDLEMALRDLAGTWTGPPVAVGVEVEVEVETRGSNRARNLAPSLRDVTPLQAVRNTRLVGGAIVRCRRLLTAGERRRRQWTLFDFHITGCWRTGWRSSCCGR
jgi:hypothetical protein